MPSKKHVHCYSAWPGDLQLCLMTELEPDGEVVHGGKRYRPILIFDASNCLVMQRDFARAFVVTPADGTDSPSEVKDRELIGTGAGW